MTLRRKISKNEISQSFDLEKLLGEKPSKEQKDLFFELAVDAMVDRTVSNSDVNGTKFADYSEAYAEKKGVGVGSVDMVLNGNMLGDIERVNTKGHRVKIKVDEDDTLKAYNHLVGDTLPKRDWWGFKNEDDLKSIISQVKESKQETEQEQIQTEPETIDLSDLRDAMNAIRLDFGDGA